MVSNFWEVGFSSLYEIKIKDYKKRCNTVPAVGDCTVHVVLSFNPNPLYTFFAAKRISDTSQLQANSKITSAATTQYLRSCFSQSFHQCTCTLSLTLFPGVHWSHILGGPGERMYGADEMCLQSPGPRPPANILSTPVLGWSLRLILASQRIPT